MTRQWQTGELAGDDAGSVVGAKIHAEITHLDRYSDGGPDEPYSDEVPLETTVERQPLAWMRAGVKMHLDLRLEAGRHFRKLLAKAGLSIYEPTFRQEYAFQLPPRDRSSAATATYADEESFQELAACAGRAIDGGDLYQYLKKNPTARASDGIALAQPADGPTLDALGATLVTWFDKLYSQPAEQGAWQAARLEHAFTCTANEGDADKVLVADEYPGGHLDWFSFDIADTPAAAQPGQTPATLTRSFLPAPLTFDGMPHTRWWKFEDSKVSFSGIDPSTTDLAKLLLIEFGLIYANDWFLLPLALPTGSLADIRGMTVTNTFGERLWIEAAGRGAEDAWQDWRMFNLTSRKSGQADTSLFLAPAVPKIQNGKPLDEVFFVRDEMANMVWAIESKVPLITGAARSGHEAARDTNAYHRAKIGDVSEPPDLAANIHYTAMTSVPENWIPFIPVHVPGSNRAIQLQRGGMLRLLEGDPLEPAKVQGQTATVREGLDQQHAQSYFVHEEEVPRSGARVTRAFQRTRWRDGRTYVWLAMAKETGRGEAASRLAFDQISTHRRWQFSALPE